MTQIDTSASGIAGLCSSLDFRGFEQAAALRARAAMDDAA